MKDGEMKFWTDPPNFMLVAVVNSVVVGIVAVQKKTEKGKILSLHNIVDKLRIRVSFIVSPCLTSLMVYFECTVCSCGICGFKDIQIVN